MIEEPSAKTCSKCKVCRPRSEMCKDARSLTGLSSWCLECMRAMQRAYNRTPEYRQKRREYKSCADVREKRSAEARTPAYREKARARYRTPERWALVAVQSIRKRSERKGLEFDLTVDDLADIPTHCPVLGIPIQIGSDTAHDNSPSVDRIDPAKGYVRGNIAIISNRANMIKNNGTIDEHMRIVAWMRSVGAP